MDFGGAPSFNSPTAVPPENMAEPSFTSNMGKPGRGPDEPDTCRICRGEGSEGEQLFYPCKCSGSIKFVHQNCLMEWLSHSQKKHCELCKTPFRFTKLYDPNMPEELPAPLFFKELAVHAGRSVLTWLRFVLVAFIWLGWLPWSMRAIWRGLFWLADGRWPASEDVASSSTAARINQLATYGTSPANHVLAGNSPAIASPTQNIPLTMPRFFSPTSSILNFTTGEPLIYSIAKRLLANAVVFTSTSSPTVSDPTNATLSSTRRMRQPSWLSDVSFLNKLTPYPTINNILIDTLEGQLITLVVVILFIHVFLIREWVVQQQPVINLAEGEREAAAQLLGENRDGQPEQPIAERREEEEVAAIIAPIMRPEGRAVAVEEQMVDNPTFEAPSPANETTASALPFNANDSDVSSFEFDPFRQPPYFQTLTADGPETTAGESGSHQGYSRLQEFRAESWANNLKFSAETNGEEEVADIEDSTFDDPNVSDVKRGKEPERENIHGPHAVESLENDTPVNGGISSPIFGNYNNGVHATPDINAPNLPPHTQEYGSHAIGSNSLRFSNAEHYMHSGTFDFNVPGSSPLHDLNKPLNFDGAISPGSANLDEHAQTRMDSDPHRDSTEQNPMAAHDDTDSHQDYLGSDVGQHGSEEDVQEHRAAMGWLDRVADWFWGGIPATHHDQENQGEEDEHIVEDPEREPPFIPVRHGRFILDGNMPAENEPHDENEPQDADEGADVNDVDAVEDADDLEGIMELIGMQGAIFGLLQNGVISALLISFTVTVGIWLPYLWGKIALVLLTNPVRLFIGIPLAVSSILADIAIDTIIGSFAYLVYSGNVLVRFMIAQIGKIIPSVSPFSGSNAVTYASLSLIDGSGQRLKRLVTTFFTFHETDLPMFSVLSHQALRIHQARIASTFQFVLRLGKTIVHDLPLRLLRQETIESLRHVSFLSLANFPQFVVAAFKDFGKSISAIGEYSNLSNFKLPSSEAASVNMDYDLTNWDTKDRMIAIAVGYCFASVMGLVYLRLSALLSGSPRGQRVEGALAEILRQAGGVMKVILIIGIEMIVFPLYCGILLDVALMPLFENATLSSRTEFTFNSPVTSLFVHWFIGTCYMFHFALFVSMCRKIMRSGVLYFIRDPDDPTFHPVRDVLERSVATQLQKIAFSAMVYGALVIICLGGVVWGLSFTFRGVLPVHWSSNEPVLEFPVDLLFYNLVMPLAIRSIKPSDILHQVYEWWFHKCARVLRLSDFLFGQKHPDEESRHAYRTWLNALSPKSIDADDSATSGDSSSEQSQEPTAQYVRDGKFVRTPASDQVRIPKGTRVFMEVSEENERLDGKPDRDDGLHGRENDMFTKVYIPPRFKTRIAAFICLIWVFAAMTGVGATILPLVVGRRLMAAVFPAHVRVNDIYAFSVGTYILGILCYAFVHCHRSLKSLRNRDQASTNSLTQILRNVFMVTSQLAKLAYAFGGVALLLPSLVAFITELYFLVPLHTYLNDQHTHTIHFVQDWTLGVLYVRMAARFMLRDPASKPARVLDSIIRNGWHNPDVKLITRALFIPAALISLVAGLCPLPLGFVLNETFFRGASAAVHSQVYRYCYPAILAVALSVLGIQRLRRQVGIWRLSIRDDVYLIGERLHNLGDKRAKDVSSARRMITS